METLDAVLPVVAVAAPAVLVLRDAVTFDRAGARGADPVAEQTVAPVAAPALAPALAPVAEPALAPVTDVTEPVPVLADPPPEVEVEAAADLPAESPAEVETRHSMLSGLSSVEADDRSPLRRVGAFVLLMAITLGTAAAVAAVIYNGVSKL